MSTAVKHREPDNTTRKGTGLVFLLIVMVGAALRFPLISSRPGYDWDETVYTNIVSNFVSGHGIDLKSQVGTSAEPYLFHPPFYFLIEGGWFKLVGSGITQARVWAALMSLIVLCLLFGWLRSSMGRTVALVATGMLSVDAWMVFTNRVSWIENTQLVIIVGGMWLYSRAMQRPSTARFVTAGLVIGFAVVFKHIGLYVVLVVLINWFIQRREKRGHFVLLASVVGVVVAYIVVMALVYNRNGHNYFLDDSWEQVRRTFGLRQSRGSITSTSDLVEPLFRQYRVFVGTLITALSAIVLLALRIIEVVRLRSMDAIRPYSLPFAWALSAVVSFSLLALKFPHYFVLVLIPLVVFLVCDVAARLSQREGVGSDRRKVIIALVAVVLLGGAGFVWRIVGHDDNALKQTEQYAQRSIPAGAIVLTEETVGAIIPQQYCSFSRTDSCATRAQYIITYESATQHLYDSSTLRRLLNDSSKQATFVGFKETIKVYRINNR